MPTTATIRRHAAGAAFVALASLAMPASAGAGTPTGDIETGYSVDLGGHGRTAARLVVPAAVCAGTGYVVASSQSLHHQANGWVTVGGVSYSGCAPDGVGGLVEDYYAMLLGPSGAQIIDRPVSPHDVIFVKVNVDSGNATVTVKNESAGWHRRDSGPVPPSDYYTIGVDTNNGGEKTTIHFRDNRVDGIALGRAHPEPYGPEDPCGSLGDIRHQLDFSVSILCGS